MNTLVQDLAYAARLLRKTPWTSGAAVLALALGIGANTAIFSVVNAVLLRPLPYPEPAQLVQLKRSYPRGDTPTLSVPQFVYWRDNNRVFTEMTAYDLLPNGYNLAGDGRPEHLVGYRVSANFFEVFGLQPALGRGFTLEDDRPGAARVMVLSHGMWQRRLGGASDVVGRKLQLNGELYEVIGVTGAGNSFSHPRGAVDLWTPLQIDVTSQSQETFLLVTGRLADGISAERARAEMKVVAEQYLATLPTPNDGQESITLQPLQEFLFGNLRPAFRILLAAVAFVLLIACANVTNLQLARSAARQKEIAIRCAAGATSGRIIRQLLTESVGLALVGGVAGIFLCLLAIPPLLAFAPAQLLTASDLTKVGVDLVVLAFTLGIALLTGIVSGLLPAFQAARSGINEIIKESSGRTVGDRMGGIIRQGLVATEVALALVLLVGASLLIKTFSGLNATDPGFETDNVVSMKLSLPASKYDTTAAWERLQLELLPAIEALPGVSQAAAVTTLPMELGPDLPFTIEGRYVAGTREGIGNGLYHGVSPGFFAALEIPLVRGERLFNAGDNATAEGVVIINETAAQSFWPDADPIGQRITIGQPFLPQFADPLPRRVIAVVGDVRELGLDEDFSPILYVPLPQIPQRFAAEIVKILPLALLYKADVGAENLVNPVKEEVWSFDPEQPVTAVRPLEEVVAQKLGSRRFNAVLLGLFAGLALVLAAVGIYGVLAYLVTQRRREIGIRMALGASRGRVVGLVLGQGLTPVVIGLVVGLVAARAMSHLIASQVYGVAVTDLGAYAVVSLLLLFIALLAMFVPTRRASRVEPTVALRYE